MKQKSSFKISAFFILLCFYMHQVFKNKAYNKVLFDKKNFGIFFLKLSFRGSEAVSCVHDRGSSMLGAKILHCRRL